MPKDTRWDYPSRVQCRASRQCRRRVSAGPRYEVYPPNVSAMFPKMGSYEIFLPGRPPPNGQTSEPYGDTPVLRPVAARNAAVARARRPVHSSVRGLERPMGDREVDRTRDTEDEERDNTGAGQRVFPLSGKCEQRTPPKKPRPVLKPDHPKNAEQGRTKRMPTTGLRDVSVGQTYKAARQAASRAGQSGKIVKRTYRRKMQNASVGPGHGQQRRSGENPADQCKGEWRLSSSAPVH